MSYIILYKLKAYDKWQPHGYQYPSLASAKGRAEMLSRDLSPASVMVVKVCCTLSGEGWVQYD